MQSKRERKSLERLAQTTDALYCWQDTEHGRQRIFCKTCHAEGKAWMTPEPCEHILSANKEQTIDPETALNTIRQMLESSAESAARQ